MMSISKPIVFFGTEHFSLITLRALIDAGFPVAAVVTKPDTQKGRGHKLTASPVKVLAQAHSIPVWQPTKLGDISSDIAQLDQPLGVLVSYGKIIPQSIIDLFTPGIINLHPSLLPLYRGPSPIESAILHGDKQTGISIMQLSAAMDAGPVYKQITHELTGTETAEHLYDELGRIGSALMVELLPHIADGTMQPTPQDDVLATYCQLIKKADGIIDWNQPAVQIERQIRAYHEWPQSRATIGAVDIIITKAQAVEISSQPAGSVEVIDEQLLIHTSDAALRIDTLKPAGKKEMPVQAFLAGYRSQISA